VVSIQPHCEEGGCEGGSREKRVIENQIEREVMNKSPECYRSVV
jgi:hypothetical protein